MVVRFSPNGVRRLMSTKEETRLDKFLNASVADLERYGLSVRIINTIENRLNIIWMRDLVKRKKEQILRVHGIENQQLNEILSSVRKCYEDMTSSKPRAYIIWDGHRRSPPAVVEAYSPGQAIEYYLATHGIMAYDKPMEILEVDRGSLKKVCELVSVVQCDELDRHHFWKEIEV